MTLRALSELSAEQARSVEWLAFDLDDTLLDHGRLGLEAFAALHALAAGGVRLVAATGRPSGFAEVVARQWPVTAAIAENGAVAWTRDETGRVRVSDDTSDELRVARRAELLAIAAEVRERFPEIDLADDNWARRTDVSLDIGEHRRVPPDTVEAARALASSLGARTFASSVHVHLTFDASDKATGFAALVRRLGFDAASIVPNAAFVGDSGNDAPAFAAFGLTFGVANVRTHLSKLPVPPMFVSPSEMGTGFAEIARRLLELRS
ncbi:MAG: HAD family phosphatase [Myxococcales bacterium]|nr:HAD family phosphatase [Myxococcales bacterium]